MSFYPHQVAGARFLADNDKAILAWCMRSGKSRTALTAAREHDFIGIICPPIALENWEREIKKWRPHLLNQVVIVPDSRIANYGPLPEIDYLIVDEAHRFKNANIRKVKVAVPGTKKKVTKKVKTERTAAMVKWLRATPRVAVLSGTIMPNRHQEMWVWARELLGMKNKKEFERKYCGGWQAPWGWDASKSTNHQALAELFKPIMMTITAEDVKDTVADIMGPMLVYLNLPADEREHNFDIDFIIKNAASIALESLSDIMKLSGLRKVPLAIEHIKDVLEQEEKVVVWCHHRDVAEALQEALDGYGAGLVYGSMRDKDKWFNIDRFQNLSDCRVIVANIQSMGTAITLDAAAYNVVVEAPWVPGDLYQAMARCGGPNQKKAVRTDILAIAGSIDGHVLEAILKKTQTIDSLNEETRMPKKKSVVIQQELLVKAEVPLAHTALDMAITNIIVSRGLEFKLDPGLYLKSLFPHLFEQGGPEPDLIEKTLEETVADNRVKVDTRRKSAKELAREQEAAAPEPTAAPAAPAISPDKLRNTLAQLIRVKNPDAAKDILAKFGAKRLSEVTEDKYAEFLDACEKACAESDTQSLLG